MELGKVNKLKINRQTDFGFYLIDENELEALLPNAYITNDMKIGDELEAFIYNDSEDRRTATTETPLVQLNQFAYLEVKEVNNVGAFLDWGLLKDLLVPFNEQMKRLEAGEWCLVYLCLDERTQRLYGTCQVRTRFEYENVDLKIGEEVEIIPFSETDLGINVVVNNKYKGLIFHNNVYREIEPGLAIKAYVKMIRPDGKLDILLEPGGYLKNIDKTSKLLMDALKKNEGELKLTDKTKPEEIYEVLGISKKSFKRAVGNLYKQKLITLNATGIKLIEKA